ncbi:MAG: class I SAM-dependent methyltransferase [Thermodesulfobacteriota bacterium]|nr:class I SAM-dependent methyltransferase [Thermodesulfobacteriota bacterium]
MSGNENICRGKTHTVSCDLCGSSRYQYLFSQPYDRADDWEWYRVVRCVDCGLAFINPQPLPEELGRFYNTGYYTKRANPKWEEKYRRRCEVLKRLPGRKVIDLGCARGDFVRYLRKDGYEVAGYEELYTHSLEDVTVYHGTPQHLIDKGEKYDIVAAWGVLPHLPKPSLYFQLANNLLQEGGHFVFTATNIDSIASRHLYAEDIPRHLTFFCPETIQQYAQQHGFHVQLTQQRNDLHTLSYLDLFGFIFHRIVGKEFRYEDSMKSRLRNGAPINPLFRRASKALAPMGRSFDRLRGRNGALVSVLKKQGTPLA